MDIEKIIRETIISNEEEIKKNVSESLKQQVIQQLDWQIRNRIDDIIKEYFQTDLKAEITEILKNNKTEILKGINEGVVLIAAEFGKKMTETATLKMADKWKFSKILKELYE